MLPVSSSMPISRLFNRTFTTLAPAVVAIKANITTQPSHLTAGALQEAIVIRASFDPHYSCGQKFCPDIELAQLGCQGE
jgi:hypothetical protein